MTRITRFQDVSQKNYGQKMSRGEGMMPLPMNLNLWRAITLQGFVQTKQLSSPSASTHLLNVQNELAWAIWSPERKVTPDRSSRVQMVTRLGVVSGNRVVIQNPRAFWVAFHHTRGVRLPKTTKGTMEGVGLSPLTLLVPW